MVTVGEPLPTNSLRVTLTKKDSTVLTDVVVKVSKDGVIEIPEFGTIKVSDKTFIQCARAIMESGKGRRLVARVGPGFIPKKGEACVTVGGQVRQPRLINMIEGLTLHQAIRLAGGANEWATLKRVKVIRDGWEKQFDLTVKEDLGFLLQDGDIVEMPFKNFMPRD